MDDSELAAARAELGGRWEVDRLPGGLAAYDRQEKTRPAVTADDAAGLREACAAALRPREPARERYAGE